VPNDSQPKVRPILGTAKDVAVFLLWNLVVGLAIIFLPAPLGAGVAVAVTLLVIHFYLLHAHHPDPSGRWLALRLRTVAPHLRLLLVAGAGFVVMVWGLSELYLGYVPVPETQLNPFDWLTATPGGRFTLAILAVGLAPVVEEFFFRGLIQSRLSRRFNAAVGILVGAGLFAAVHMLVWVFPIHFLLGAAFGLVVWVTRSIWAGVFLHAVNNLLALLGIGLGDAAGPPEPGVGPGDMLAWYIAGLVLGGAVFLWACREVYRRERVETPAVRETPVSAEA